MDSLITTTMQINKLAIIACNQYCLAASATQGNNAYTQNVIANFRQPEQSGHCISPFGGR